MTEEERDALIDRLPTDTMILWPDDEELSWFPNRNYEEWRDILGHPRAHSGCCKTCGCAGTCLLGAFFDSVVSSVIRELDKLGALKPADVEHCVHSRAMHDRHHQQHVDGCPWCTQPGTTLIDPGDLL